MGLIILFVAILGGGIVIIMKIASCLIKYIFAPFNNNISENSEGGVIETKYVSHENKNEKDQAL